jgi:hypothetical protein
MVSAEAAAAQPSRMPASTAVTQSLLLMPIALSAENRISQTSVIASLFTGRSNLYFSIQIRDCFVALRQAQGASQ